MQPVKLRPTRRAFLSGSAAIAAAGALPLSRAIASDPHDTAFMVVGDWGKLGIGELQVAAAMQWCAANSRCRFVISVGDYFYDVGVVDVDDPQWQLTFERVFSGSSLQVPWYSVLGNHDYSGNPNAEVEYTGNGIRWQMPAHFYRHQELLADGSQADFFFIDTNLLTHPREAAEIAGVNPRAQLRWLEDQLADSRARWKLVIGHHPVFSGGERHGNTPELVREVKPMLDRYGVQAYFNGHDHNLQHLLVDNVHYLTSGSGAESRSVGRVTGTIFAANTLGFIDAQFRGGRLAIEFIDAAGAALHSVDIISAG